MAAADDDVRIGTALDHLATNAPSHAPPVPARPPRGAVLVTSIRNEGLTIAEWVAHHRLIGFDRILVYTNDNTDGSDDLLRAMRDMGLIELVFNEVAAGVSPQLKAYRHAWFMNPSTRDHEWCCLLDADEFLVPLIDGAMVDVGRYADHLTAVIGADAVCLNWKWFVSGGAYRMTSGTLFRRFTNAYADSHVKTFFRLGAARDIGIHTPSFLADARVVDGAGLRRENAMASTGTPRLDLGQVNHYWNKSFEEFYLKRQRGRGAHDQTLRDWTTFFAWGGVEGSPDAWPGDAHIRRVEATLRTYADDARFAAASAGVDRATRALLDPEDVRAAFDQARGQGPAQP